MKKWFVVKNNNKRSVSATENSLNNMVSLPSCLQYSMNRWFHITEIMVARMYKIKIAVVVPLMTAPK